MSVLFTFSSAFSVGGEGFFWVRYFIFCLFMIRLHSCTVLCRSFWYLSLGSLGNIRKLLVMRNVCTFSEYSLEFMITMVLPLLACGIPEIVHQVGSFYKVIQGCTVNKT
jgi:hypothetical protein